MNEFANPRTSQELTPAVARILAGLCEQTSASSPLAAQLLLGLLNESECRAALVLAQHCVGADDVVARWPELAEAIAPLKHSDNSNGNRASISSATQDPNADLSSHPEWLLVISRAGELLSDFPQPLALATEHVLLGLVGGEGEVADWLREQGLKDEDLLTKLRQQFGIETTPLAIDPVDEQVPVESSQERNVAEPQPTTSAQEAEETNPALPPEEFDDDIAAFLSQKPSEENTSVVPNNLNNSNNQAGQGGTLPETAVFRAIDAAGNRAAEGMRVLEDVCRFGLNDAFLTCEIKNLRHAVAGNIARLPNVRLLAARDVPNDVGTALTTSSEQNRASTADLLTANFRRVQESLRSLEEFCKLVNVEVAAAFKQLRYASYTLHRSACLSRSAEGALATARLYVLLDGGASPQAFEHLAKSLIDAGVPLLQLRDKQLNDRELLERGRAVMQFASGTATRVIINDRPDIAAALNAAGVHLGQEELTTAVARSVLHPDALIGISTHALPQARQAVLDGADYLGVGPTFPSTTKSFVQFPGLEYAHAVASEVSLPAYAIGGITLQNLEHVLATGVHGVAVGAAITAANDPPAAAKEFLRVLG